MLVALLASIFVLLKLEPTTASVWWSCAVVAPAILEIISFAKPLWLSRYLAFSFPPLVLTVSFCVATTFRLLRDVRVRRVAWSALALVFLLAGSLHRPFTGVVPLGDAQEAAEWINDNRPPDGVLVVAAHDAMDFYHYFGYDPKVDRTLVSAPTASTVYPVRTPLNGVDEDLLQDHVFIYVGTGGLNPELVSRFGDRRFELIAFANVQVLHLLPSGST